MNNKIALRALYLLLITAVFVLPACSQGTPDLTEESINGILEDFQPVVSATGIVLPSKRVVLSFPTAGIVDVIMVEEGEMVEKGKTLVALEGREQAQAALEAARFELILANQSLDEAHRTSELVSAQTQLALANAQDALEDAEYNWRVQQEGYRASQSTIDTAQASLVIAEEEVDRTKANYDSYSGRSEDDAQRAMALIALSSARSARDSAIRNLNWYLGHPDDTQQAILDAKLSIAEAELGVSEQNWARVKGGPDPETIERAAARVATAKAQLKAAEAALSILVLEAPFAGTISEVYTQEKEWVAPGQPLIVFADLQTLTVETTDLNEIDAAQIEIGDHAIATFDALPDIVVEGQVVYIASKSDEGSGVNYKVILELNEIPEKVRWGMTAFVDIEIGS
ncbi:MAG: efflux RND transporter periplasmic adaptor subunit [Anaerolineales bacterium]|jgi:multidrug efflux pump subunit AcrA (membrane-fusion protein)|nr:efflux RND transporter periplasmic adaptor subunit [Anaerolineales bacterium]